MLIKYHSTHASHVSYYFVEIQNNTRNIYFFLSVGDMIEMNICYFINLASLKQENTKIFLRNIAKFNSITRIGLGTKEYTLCEVPRIVRKSWRKLN